MLAAIREPFNPIIMLFKSKTQKRLEWLQDQKYDLRRDRTCNLPLKLVKLLLVVDGHATIAPAGQHVSSNINTNLARCMQCSHLTVDTSTCVTILQ